MKKIIKVSVFFVLFSLLTAGSCESEEDACANCIAAQEHYIEALLGNGCSLVTTGPAREKVVNTCDNGLAKATAIQTACANGDPQPVYNCN